MRKHHSLTLPSLDESQFISDDGYDIALFARYGYDGHLCISEHAKRLLENKDGSFQATYEVWISDICLYMEEAALLQLTGNLDACV